MHLSLSDYLLDLGQNSFEAGASIINITLNQTRDSLSLIVEDNGCGMDEKTVASAIDPFFTEEGKHDKRNVGLGLSFIKQLVDHCGGQMRLKSELNRGTVLDICLPLDHIDLPPLGSLTGALVSLMTMDGDYDLFFERVLLDESYRVSRGELLTVLGDLSTVTSISLARDFLKAQEETVKEGAEDAKAYIG